MAKYIPDFRVGDSYKLSLVVKDEFGVAVDITGYVFWLTLKAAFTDADVDAVLQFKTTVGDNPSDDALNGICNLYVPAADTKAVPVGKYFYDIQQLAGTDITTILPPVEDYKDKLSVLPEVTVAIT